eukprot:7281964-Heterocapsa_arctica.AAC.1
MVNKCRDKMTKHPSPAQSGSGAKHFCECKWAELDPLIIKLADQVSTNLADGFLRSFLNASSRSKRHVSTY